MSQPPFDVAEQVRRHGAALRQLAIELVGEAGGADDAVQETWLGALRRPPRHQASPGGWLATVLRHVVGVQRRAARRRARREHEVARRRGYLGEDHAEAIAGADEARRLIGVVEALDAPYRDAIWRRFFAGEKPRAIAAAHGVPVATVQSWLKRGLTLLRERLGAGAEPSRDWRGGLVAAFGLERVMPGAAATTTATVTTGGACVTAGTKGFVAAVAILAVVAGAWWWADDAAVTPGAPPRSAPVVPVVASAPPLRREPAAPDVAAPDPTAVAGTPDAVPSAATAAEDPGFVQGRAVDLATGEPLPGVRVTRAIRTTGEVPLETVTAADGTFVLAGRVGPPTWIELRRPDRVTLTWRGDVPPRGQAVDTGDLALRRGRVIVGQVVDATGGGVPEQLLVTVDFEARYERAWSEQRGQGRTVAGGRFAMTEPLPTGPTKWNLPFGSVELVGAGDRNLPVEIALGESEPAEVVLTVKPRPTIRGHVVDEAGQPAAGVSLSDLPGPFGMTQVQSDGSFTMLRSRGGDAADVYVAGAPGFAPVPPIRGVAWGTSNLRIVLQRTRPIPIEVVDAGGRPVEQFGVALARAGLTFETIGKVRQQGTHAAGRCAVDDAVIGATHLRIVPASPALAPSEPVLLDGAAPQRIVLQPRVRSTVLVRRGGEPVADAWLHLLRERGGAMLSAVSHRRPEPAADRVWMQGAAWDPVSAGRTAADGRSTMWRDTDTSDCVLRVAAPGHAAHVLRAPAWPADDVPLVVDLPGAGLLVGAVDVRGGDRSTIVVEIAGTAHEGDRALVVGPDGELPATNLPAGAYTLRLRARTPALLTLATKQVTVAVGATTTVRFDLADHAPGSLRGTVVAASGNLPADLVVDLLRVGDDGQLPRVASAAVAADGTFTASNLVPGTYRAALRTRGPGPADVPAIEEGGFVVTVGRLATVSLRYAPRRLVVRLLRPGGAAVRGERVLMRCGGASWPSMRLFAPTVDEVLVLDPAPAVPVEFRNWTDGSPWSQAVATPPGRGEAEVTVVLPDGPAPR